MFSYNFHQIDNYDEGAVSVYDWIDDLSVFQDPAWLLRRNHDRGLREATLLACVARPLLEQARLKRPDAIYLPNAAEYERFAAAAEPAPDAALADFLRKGTPVAGYYGALAHWFDYSLLRAIADKRPDWSFVLIGPDLDGSIRGHDVLRCPNVIWLGPRDYDTLPGYLRFFDVALIPFVINAITKATSPLKLYEYFSAGKPVITTPMPECLAHPEVHVVRWVEEFADALDEALAESRSEASRQSVQAVGAANSWAARARLIEAHLPNRHGAVKAAA